MKILKIAIVLIPLMAAVSCQKSDLKPSNCNDHEATTPSVASKTSNDNSNQSEDNSNQENWDSNAKKVGGATVVETLGSTTEGTEIIGSGDDDRDGGDKKKKLVK